MPHVRFLMSFFNDVARTLKKLRTSKGDYCIKQWFPAITSLFKMESISKERICSYRERTFCFKISSLLLALRAVPYGMANHFTTLGELPRVLLFLLRTCVYCVMGITPMIFICEKCSKRHLHGSRGGIGGPDPPPLKNHKAIGFLSYTGLSPLKNQNHKV